MKRSLFNTLTIWGRMLLASTLLIFAAACSRQVGPPATVVDDPIPMICRPSTETMQTGGRLMVSLSIDHPAGSTLEVPDPGREKEIVLRGREFQQAELSEELLRSTYTYDLSSFRPGRYSVSDAEIVLTLSDGSIVKAPFPKCEFEVRSALNEGQAAWQGIRDLHQWPPSRKWLFIALIAVVAVLAVSTGGIIALILWLRKKAMNRSAPPPLPAHVIAFNELSALERDQLIEKHEIEPFFVRLSGIVRNYLQNRFDIHAPEQTTEEFIRSTYENKLLSQEHSSLLGHFMEQSDLVKFARFEPDEAVMRSALESGKAFVKESSVNREASS